MAAHDDLKKALFLPFIAGALGTAGRVVGSYIASRGAASAARRGVGVAARAVRSGIATAKRLPLPWKYVPETVRLARRNPTNSAPASPMKIEAGAKL